MANLRALAAAAARRYGINPQIFLRQIQQESGFNPRAHSPAGAQGIAQFMPGTARGMGVNPYNPRSALFGAARMDAQNLHKYGNWQDVLSLYNSGRGWSQGQRIGETRNYVHSILGGSSSAASPARSGFSPGQSAAPTPAQSALPGLKLALAQNLISANQSISRGEQPDYTSVFQALAAIRNTPRSAPQSPQVGPGPPTQIPHGSRGVVNFEGKPVAGWIAPLLKAARKAGWQGSVMSGYRSYEQQSRIYRSGVRPAAKPGTSNHEMTGFPGGAVDVSDAEQLDRILRRLGIHSLRWAGGKDPVHFSHPHGGSY